MFICDNQDDLFAIHEINVSDVVIVVMSWNWCSHIINIILSKWLNTHHVFSNVDMEINDVSNNASTMRTLFVTNLIDNIVKFWASSHYGNNQVGVTFDLRTDVHLRSRLPFQVHRTLIGDTDKIRTWFNTFSLSIADWTGECHAQFAIKRTIEQKLVVVFKPLESCKAYVSFPKPIGTGKEPHGNK